jgi:hypothetical protein
MCEEQVIRDAMENKPIPKPLTLDLRAGPSPSEPFDINQWATAGRHFPAPDPGQQPPLRPLSGKIQARAWQIPPSISATW